MIDDETQAKAARIYQLASEAYPASPWSFLIGLAVGKLVKAKMSDEQIVEAVRHVTSGALTGARAVISASDESKPS